MWTCPHSVNQRFRSEWASDFPCTAVQSGHGALSALFEQQRDAVHRRGDGFQNQILLRTRRARQHIIDDVGFVAGMSYPQTHAPEGLADMRDGVAQAIVAAMAAPLLQAHRAHRQVELIMRDQDLLWRDFLELAQLANR